MIRENKGANCSRINSRRMRQAGAAIRPVPTAATAASVRLREVMLSPKEVCSIRKRVTKTTMQAAPVIQNSSRISLRNTILTAVSTGAAEQVSRVTM